MSKKDKGTGPGRAPRDADPAVDGADLAQGGRVPADRASSTGASPPPTMIVGGRRVTIDTEALDSLNLSAREREEIIRNISLGRYSVGDEVQMADAGPSSNPTPKEDDEKFRELENTIRDLRARLAQTGRSGEEVRRLRAEIDQKEKLRHVWHRVSDSARLLLMASEEFRKSFDRESCSAFVLSIDIRRSTELMLKANHPRDFARFILDLSQDLRSIVWAHFGIFDKFTGDGILAFFPDFYTGPDAGFLAVMAAEMCHKAFARVYATHRDCFISILKDVGLGIGVDYGEVFLVSHLGELTVVGNPVVYACRLGNAPAGVTLLNDRARRVIAEKYQETFEIHEGEIEIKNEGTTIVHSVKQRQDGEGDFRNISFPAWQHRAIVAQYRKEAAAQRDVMSGGRQDEQARADEAPTS
jgi:class 3 adenylate cyclase